MDPKTNPDAGTPDEDEDETPPAEGGAPAGPTARTEARRNRFKEQQEAAARASAEAATEREARHKAEVEAAELRGKLATRAEYESRQQRTSGDEEHKAKLTELRKQLKATYASGTDDAFERGQEIEDKIADLRESRRIETEWEKRQKAAPAVDPNATARQVELQILGTEFPFITSDAKAQRIADSYIDIMVAQGAPNNLETKRAAVRRAAADLNIAVGGGSGGDPTQRKLYGAVAGGGGSPQVNSPAGLSSEEEKMTRIIGNMKDRGLDGAEFAKRFAARKLAKAKAGG